VALRRHFEQGLPIFPVLLPGVDPDALPPFLSLFQAERLAGDLSDVDYASLAERLDAKTGAGDAPARLTPGTCPFPGLEAFQRDDAAYFFGRQVETLRALRLFGPGEDGIYRRWLQVDGPSGVGKSSLVRAGLVPAIERGWLGVEAGRAGDGWRLVSPMRPGMDPIENLATVLAEAFTVPTSRIDATLRDPGDTEARALRLLLRDRGHVAAGHGLVLIVDQFEELFTLTEDPAHRARFDALLATALADLDGPLHLITTVRTDFRHRIAELPRLRALLDDRAGSYLLPPMVENGLRDVVYSPASLARLAWSDPELPKEIVQAAGQEPGGLPLVGNLLRLLWEEREGNVLSRQVYRDLGGLGGALANRADQLIEGLGAGGQERARRLLLELVQPLGEGQATRRTITRARAIAAAGGGLAAEQVLSRLTGARDELTPEGARALPRLVMITAPPESEPAEGTGRAGADRVDLAHEALLTRWPRLRTWIEARETALRERAEVERAARKWHGEGEGPVPWSHERMLEAGQALKALGPDLGLDEIARRFLGPVDAAAMVGDLAKPATTHAERATIGVRLALLGDPRPGVGLDADGLPDILWREVPGGEVTLSIEPKRGFLDRFRKALSEGDRFSVEPFAMARYPVTWGQYRAFLEAEDSYQNGEWWPVQGPYSNPPSPSDPYANHPMTDVNWFEALAFCSWLSARRGYTVRLPTEWEWQQAATGGDPGHVYPWGPKWEDGRANTYESELRALTAVGCYPHGASPQGVEDLAGTVWEWCQNQYDRPKVIEVTGEARRVLRGGSWISGDDYARSVARNDHYPDDRYTYVGFRVVRSSPIE
jgi:formylglycine-generating enzyme required for sulfatase activity